MDQNTSSYNSFYAFRTQSPDMDHFFRKIFDKGLMNLNVGVFSKTDIISAENDIYPNPDLNFCLDSY